MSGRISFIGAGPGAADLITVRGARRIAEADVVVWAASLVTPECVQEHANPGAELVDSSRLTHEDAVEIYRRAERDRLKVARVHSGDPALWGAVQEQYDACARMDLEVEIVPGVPAFSAAAAAVGRELTVPEIAQSVVLTRLEGGKTPMPDGEKVRQFAEHGTTMALFLSAARTGQMVQELRAGGYSDDTPVLVAYQVTWPDELLLRTTLGELEQTVKQHKLWRHTLFLVGRALSEGGTRSRLYDAGHFHTYRRADPAARRALREKTGTARRRSRGPETSAEAVPEQRTEFRNSAQPGSDVAWWAVRDWQETARATSRGTAAKRRVEAADLGQPDLFVEASEAPEAAVAEAAPAQPESPAEAPVVEKTPAAEEVAAVPDGTPAAEEEQPKPKTSAARKTGARTSRAKAKASPKTTGTRAKSGAKTTGAKRKTGSGGQPDQD